MKLIIAGSRHLNLRTNHIDCYFDQFKLHDQVSEIISGGASGVDKAGEQYANLVDIKIYRVLPEWNLYGQAAGPIRNAEMAEYGDSLLLIWDGESRGSASMKREMEKLNKPIYEVILKKEQSDV